MKKGCRFITIEDVKFVYENYSSMSALQIAEKLGLSTSQVNKIVHELRKRGVKIPKKRDRKVKIFDVFVEKLKKEEVTE